MRIERLEVSGFKSFPDRSDLVFDQGVTAIVGPNGCGKSNIVDAITWVLGEQSAKSLRGDRMEDVIFAGSDARKPTSAAEVKLRLSGVTVRGRSENGNGAGVAEEEEMREALAALARDVEVGRRLYRSGESEYLIDGEVCRLRDVQDLLMDSGVGFKGYAVIEQGKIGQILSARPAERRQLIEEAAGVTKYKSRRRAAELKLEAAQQNLTRIDDIIYELDKQRGSLKRQAAKAHRYRRLREELRRWEKLLFARRFAALSQTIELARERLDEARTAEAGAAGRVAEIEADLARLRIETVEADSLANALRERAHGAELANEKRQQQIAFDTQQVAALGQTLTDIAVDLEQLQARREPARVEIDERGAAAARADAERDEAARLLAGEEAAHASAAADVVALEQAVEASRRDVFSGHNAVTALTHAIERATEARERLGQELSRLDIEDTDLAHETGRATADREKAGAVLKTIQAELEDTRASLAAQSSALASARIEREWRANDVRARERELAAMTARLASLEELDAARAGYGDAARLLLSTAESGVADHGSVADYLDVDRAHERAIEACLGELLQYVIVDDIGDARRALDYVRAHDAGRCGLLVAGRAGDRPRASEAPPVAGLVDLTAVLRVSGPYADVIRQAIGDVWLADSFDVANAAALRTTARVVTRDGDVLQGRHLVAGGGKEAARGILATKREIKELREKRAAEQQTLHELAADVAAFEARIAQAEQAIAALEAAMHRHEKAILGQELHAARAADELERLERRRELLTSERRRAREELESIARREDEARLSIADLQGTQRDLESQLETTQARLLESRERQAAASHCVAEAKASHAALVERSFAIAQEVRRLAEASSDLEARVGARLDERGRTEGRRSELERAIEAGQRQLDRDLQAFLVLRQDVTAADARVAGIQSDLARREQEAGDARRELEAVRASVSQVDLGRATAEADLGHLAESCQEHLQATLEQVAAEIAQLEASNTLPTPGAVAIEDELEGEELEMAEEGGLEARGGELPAAGAVEAAPGAAPGVEETIAGLKGKIERLGPVNMMAIEQFDELETRHAFLTSQRKDLVESIAQTGEAIRRIDKTTRERFKEAFEAINVHFDRMFKTLFGGGRAGLVLIDETDELESGIDIIAQPPGKRLQNVQLLSGGEKALTAMSLMFGLFAYRPSPFCLLDEIDAPLDDANVARFIDMLQGMQHHTQFIVITHHRRTMEMADRLYGVTMEEPGVSKLISVKLN